MLIENAIGEYWDAVLMNGSVNSEILDMEVARQQVGVGGQLWLWMRCNVIEDFGEGETFIFSFVQDDAEGMGSKVNVFSICDTDATAIVTADAESTPFKTAGMTIWASSLPYTVTKRYTRWECIHTTGTAVLKVDAQLLAGAPPANMRDSQIYSSNVTVPN